MIKKQRVHDSIMQITKIIMKRGRENDQYKCLMGIRSILLVSKYNDSKKERVVRKYRY